MLGSFPTSLTLKDIAFSIHNGFMHSVGHRENVLEPYHKTLGIGVYIEHNTNKTLTIYSPNVHDPVSGWTNKPATFQFGQIEYIMYIAEEFCEPYG